MQCDDKRTRMKLYCIVLSFSRSSQAEAIFVNHHIIYTVLHLYIVIRRLPTLIRRSMSMSTVCAMHSVQQEFVIPNIPDVPPQFADVAKRRMQSSTHRIARRPGVTITPFSTPSSFDMHLHTAWNPNMRLRRLKMRFDRSLQGGVIGTSMPEDDNDDEAEGEPEYEGLSEGIDDIEAELLGAIGGADKLGVIDGPAVTDTLGVIDGMAEIDMLIDVVGDTLGDGFGFLAHAVSDSYRKA